MKKAIFIVILSLILAPAFVLGQQNSSPSPSVTVSTTICTRLTFNLYPGSQDYSTNGQVTLLQNFLVQNNYGSFSGRGSYGPLTFQAVQQFQRANGIIPLGLVGPVTRAKISSLTCFPVNQGVSISSTQPSTGPIGTQVTLSGSGFSLSNNTIYLDNFPALNVSFVDGLNLTFTIPYQMPLTPGIIVLPGPLMIRVSSFNGSSNTVTFNVSDSTTQAPTISSLSPSSGPIGTQVTISGAGFTSTSNTIRLGSNSIGNWPASDSHNLTFTLPSYGGPYCPPMSACPAIAWMVTPGVYPLSIVNSNGTSNSLNFTVSNSSMNPSISYLSPTYGPTGTTVTIYGNGFTSNGNSINFSGVSNFNLNNLSSYDGHTIVFSVPGGDDYPCLHSNPRCAIAQRMTTPGDHSVSVTNANGTSNSLNFNVNGGYSTY